jgi:hypothetical protein
MITGDVYRQVLNGSDNKIFGLDGWRLTSSLLVDLARKKVTKVKLIDRETRLQYTARLQDFELYGVEVEYNFVKVRVLPLRWWRVEKV